MSIRRARQLRRQLSLPEGLLWRELRARPGGFKFRHQHPVGPYTLDFFCHRAGLAIEVDGVSHEMGDNPERDARRDRWLAERGVMTLRVTASDVLGDIEAMVRLLVHLCGERSPSPRFRGEGDRPKDGGGVLFPKAPNCPSTMLRMVPLPCKGRGGIRRAGP